MIPFIWKNTAELIISVCMAYFHHLHNCDKVLNRTERASLWQTSTTLITLPEVNCIWLLKIGSQQGIKGKLHPKPKLSMFCMLSQIISTVLKNDISILKQIEKIKIFKS